MSFVVLAAYILLLVSIYHLCDSNACVGNEEACTQLGSAPNWFPFVMDMTFWGLGFVQKHKKEK